MMVFAVKRRPRHRWKPFWASCDLRYKGFPVCSCRKRECAGCEPTLQRARTSWSSAPFWLTKRANIIVPEQIGALGASRASKSFMSRSKNPWRNTVNTEQFKRTVLYSKLPKAESFGYFSWGRGRGWGCLWGPSGANETKEQHSLGYCSWKPSVVLKIIEFII